ncbi:MAG: hypothetical protein AAGG48_14465 [Planctomycetota bacterium]
MQESAELWIVVVAWVVAGFCGLAFFVEKDVLRRIVFALVGMVALMVGLGAIVGGG